VIIVGMLVAELYGGAAGVATVLGKPYYYVPVGGG